MSRKIYTASIIGTGRIGFTLGFDKKREQPASHAFALKANPRIKIVAGCDTDSGRLAEFKKHFPEAACYSDSKDFFEKNKSDIITVAVNEDSHLDIALKAIRARPLLVILEKPVALNMSQARRIKKEAEKYSVPVLVNHERRFAVDYNLAADYLLKIGDVQSIDARLYSGLRVYSPKDEESGAYSLLHDGTHLADIVLFFLERISESQTGTKRLLKNPVITGIARDKKDRKIIRNFSAHYATKAVPDITLSISGRSRFFGFEIDITGTEGRIKIGNGILEFYSRQESKLYTGFYSLEKDKTVELPKKTLYFSNMISNAVDFLDSKAELKSTLDTGMNALAVLEDIKNALM